MLFSKTFLLKKIQKTGTVIENDLKGLTRTFKTRKYTLLRPEQFVVTNITSLKKSIKRNYKFFSFVWQKSMNRTKSSDEIAGARFQI